MKSDLKTGDMAIIVRNPGGCKCSARHIGMPFQVLDVMPLYQGLLMCHACLTLLGPFTGIVKYEKNGSHDPETRIKGCWVPFSWIIKIDPPAAGSEEEKFQPRLKEQDKLEAELNAMKKGLRRDFDKLTESIKEITKTK